MKSRRSWWLLPAFSVILAAGAAGAANAEAPLVGGHESDAATALSTGTDCPERGRTTTPKPVPKPKPETEPARERPPASLPCCNGADCSCSGPPPERNPLPSR